MAGNGSCANSPVQFTDMSQLNGGPPITNWNWNFGDPSSGANNTSTAQHPMHLFSTGGSFTVHLMVTNAYGCIDSLPGGKAVIVQPTPVAGFSFEGSCIQSPIQFTDESTTSSGTIVARAWNFGDPSSGVNNTSTLANPVHTFNIAGTYWVSLRVTNSNQCFRDTTIMVITNPKPIADFQYSAVCEHDPTTFTDLSIAPNSTVKSWLWDFGDGGTDNIQNPSHEYLTAGTYLVKLVVTNLDNCTDSVTKQVVVRYKPLADFNYLSYYCPANKVDFQDSSHAYGGASITSRLWTFEPGFTSGIQNPSHYFSNDNTSYQVSLMVTDNFGCKDTIVNNVDVISGFDLTFNYDTACYGTSTRFKAVNLAAGDTLLTLSWDFGDPDSPLNHSNIYEPEHQFTRTGTFIVWLKAWNSNNCVDSVYRMVDVKKLTEPDFVFQTTVCNDTVRFQDKSKPGFGTITSWKWIWGDGTSSSFTPPQTGDTVHKFSFEGTYAVKLIVTNSHGCVDSIEKNVTVTCITAAFTQVNSFNCSSDSIAFHDLSTPVNKITSWHWDFGGPTLDYASFRDTVKYKFAPGSYLVSLTVKTLSGGVVVSSLHSLNIMVSAAPVANFNSNTVCFGDSTRYNDLSQDNQVPIIERKWYFGDGSSASYPDSIVNPVHKYQQPGVFNNKFLIRNTIGCRDSIIKQVIVHKLPVAKFTSSPPCQRYDIEFTDGSKIGDTAIAKWWWYFNDPQNQNDTLKNNSVTNRYDSAGIYPVYFKVMDKNGCADDSLYSGFEIKQSPVAAFTITDNVDGMPGKIRLNNESIGARENAYRWDYQTGTSTGNPSPVVTYKYDNLVYTINLVVWNDDNCYDTTWLNYEFKFDNLYVPNAFAPDNVVLGVRMFKPKGMNLSEYHAMVFDKWGHMVWESQLLTDDGTGMPVEGWDGTFEGKPMPQDVYMWKISATFSNGKVWEGSTAGSGSTTTMGTVTLIR
ncbi:MAG: PKD domain-containing protein [Bacteroidetes bacterium]|nr:PKD domain-containing protein [Bacteroidota bacterium]